MVRYNDRVRFFSKQIDFVDGNPVEVTQSQSYVKCDVQPSTQKYKSTTSGDLQQAAFDVFIPIPFDLSTIINAKTAEFNGKIYSVVGFYEKQKFSHEVVLGYAGN